MVPSERSESEEALTDVNWGPTGELVYNRTYSRTKPDGSKETWPETVERVVDGNLALVDSRYHQAGEREDLIRLMTEFKIIPAGRHLWASGVKNAQHLFNCWVAGWPANIADHFQFTFMRLMEGGGVGANYSNHFLEKYPSVKNKLKVHIVCDDHHKDYEQMREAGVLSEEYDSAWAGAFVIEDSREGWAAALTDLIETYFRTDHPHANRVYDVTRIRPQGAKLKTFGGQASGPLPFAKMLQKVSEVFNSQGCYLTGIDAMTVDHAIAQCVVAGGVRRSARMAMMHWRDSQIEEFINIKEISGEHWTTNISVEVDEEFWAWNAEPVGSFPHARHTHAHGILRLLSEGAVRNGEPGMWDSSLSNVGEPNRVICTNPCGEITLEPWEPCNLGHVNLAAFITTEPYSLDNTDLLLAHHLMTRFLIRATFSPVADPRSRKVLDRNRRIGVGHLGVASWLALCGIKYSEAANDPWVVSKVRQLAAQTSESASEYAHQLRIPVPVKMRTVAPTGTVAKMPGVSEGIHPIFSKFFIRRVRFNEHSDYAELARLVNEGYEVEPDLFAPNTAVVSIPTKDILVDQVVALHGPEGEEYVEGANDLSLTELLDFQAMYQKHWADNAVSFTANVETDQYGAEDVALVLRKYAGRIKGSTLFPEKSYPQAPYERITKEQYEAASAKSVEDGVDEACANGACPIR